MSTANCPRNPQSVVEGVWNTPGVGLAVGLVEVTTELAAARPGVPMLRALGRDASLLVEQILCLFR